MALCGDAKDITLKHPDFGEMKLGQVSGTDATYNHGGLRVNDDNAMVDSSGRQMVQQNRKLATLQFTIHEDPANVGEGEYIDNVTQSGNPVTCIYTSATGMIYSLTGHIVGDNDAAFQNGQRELTIRGPKLVIY